MLFNGHVSPHVHNDKEMAFLLQVIKRRYICTLLNIQGGPAIIFLVKGSCLV